MAITFKFFTCLFVAQVASGNLSLVPSIINADVSSTCSCVPQVEREDARLNIKSYIRDFIVTTLSMQSAPSCGPGQWHRVAYLNMSDPSQQCPSAWREYNTSGVRACGRQYSVSCSSVNYTTNGFRYRRVCGQVIGYQLGSTDVFDNSHRGIDEAYVDGVSITHGTPRTHIWTYAAGEHDYLGSDSEIYSCPCLLTGSNYIAQTPPLFVSNDYYCESGNPDSGYPSSIADTNDLLWDGQQCEGQCCSDGKSPPWFSVELPNPTTDDIEVRLCDTDTIDGEDTPIKMLELYIQV